MKILNDMKSNINLYSHAEKVFKESIKGFYETVKSGSYDFPTKQQWLNEEWKQFKRNNPKLCGLTYDKENKDWVHESLKVV